MHLSRRFYRLLVLAFAGLFSLAAAAQFSGPQSGAAPVGDKSALKPPAGARVALYEFEDLECPQCARENPVLKAAAEKYEIPWMRHDFPLPQHNWSFQAAVNARWFDTKSKKLGDDYRDAVFANQRNIATLDDLRSFTEKFATDHKLAFPFAIDPQGKFAAEVNSDKALGERIGVEHTPTIWIVTNRTGGAPAYIEVTDSTKLYQMIDQALAETKPAPAHNTSASLKH